jgi:hypothetical protein
MQEPQTKPCGDSTGNVGGTDGEKVPDLNLGYEIEWGIVVVTMLVNHANATANVVLQRGKMRTSDGGPGSAR